MTTFYDAKIVGHRMNSDGRMTTEVEIPVTFTKNGHTLSIDFTNTFPGKVGEIGERVKIEISTASTSAVSD